MVKVNMMCGKRNFGDDWVHVDGGEYGHIVSKDIYLSSWPDASVDLLYCSHGIAYFDRDEIVSIFEAWKRVLNTGGLLRLATPDMQEISDRLCRGNDIEVFLGPIFGKMKMGNDYVYHKTGYEFIGLRKILSSIGFEQIRFYDHRLTEHPNTGNREDKYDDHSAAYHNGVLISLNVECTKP